MLPAGVSRIPWNTPGWIENSLNENPGPGISWNTPGRNVNSLNVSWGSRNSMEYPWLERELPEMTAGGPGIPGIPRPLENSLSDSGGPGIPWNTLGWYDNSLNDNRAREFL
jgi:hypothetical protein